MDWWPPPNIGYIIQSNFWAWHIWLMDIVRTKWYLGSSGRTSNGPTRWLNWSQQHWFSQAIPSKSPWIARKICHGVKKLGSSPNCADSPLVHGGVSCCQQMRGPLPLNAHLTVVFRASAICKLEFNHEKVRSDNGKRNVTYVTMKVEIWPWTFAIRLWNVEVWSSEMCIKWFKHEIVGS